MSMNKHILVTGGAGYIGSHTIVQLVEYGYIPIIADDFRNSNKIVLSGLDDIIGHQIVTHEVDICDYSQLKPLFEKYHFDGIIHFAADKAVGESVNNPLKYYKNNIGGLVNVLELSVEFNVPNFVFSSSCTVYGEPIDIKEVDELTKLSKANSPYGNTKLIGEQILQDLHTSGSDIKIISLRYFNPIGAHPSGLIGEFPVGKPNNLLPFVTQTAIGKQKELTVFGNDYPTTDGTCVRDYIHVCDLADAHVKALDLLQKKERNFIDQVNIGTGKGTSVLEIITAFKKLTGEKLNWKFGPRRNGDVVEIYANVAKSESLLNWKCKYNFQDAILHAWQWEKHLAQHV